MGYTYSSLKNIISSKNLFKDKNILTLGTLYPYLSKREVMSLERLGLNMQVPKDRFSEYLFIDYLEARSCQSLDVSDYQHSNIICNLNCSLPESYLGKYDVVIDAGTLEHLSNLSVALLNIFGLLRGGGIYYFGVPCNNWVDHGFFQFSPTFFIDLCKENPSLELLELEISTEFKYYNYYRQSPAFRNVLLKSSHKLGIVGIIRKRSSLISLDLIQSKYRGLYISGSDRDEAQKMQSLSISQKSLISGWMGKFTAVGLNCFCQSNLIPLIVKEYVLNKLYYMKHRFAKNKNIVK